MKRVKVDFSTTVRGGMIRASQARVVGRPLQQGEEVLAIDPSENLEYVGTVEEFSDDGRFVYLRMAWHSAALPSPLAPAAAAAIGSVPDIGLLSGLWAASANLVVGFGAALPGLVVTGMSATVGDHSVIHPPFAPVGYRPNFVDPEPGHSSSSRPRGLAGAEA